MKSINDKPIQVEIDEDGNIRNSIQFMKSSVTEMIHNRWRLGSISTLKANLMKMSLKKCNTRHKLSKWAKKHHDTLFPEGYDESKTIHVTTVDTEGNPYVDMEEFDKEKQRLVDLGIFGYNKHIIKKDAMADMQDAITNSSNPKELKVAVDEHRQYLMDSIEDGSIFPEDLHRTQEQKDNLINMAKMIMNADSEETEIILAALNESMEEEQ